MAQMASEKEEPRILCPLCPLSRQEAGKIPAQVVGPFQGPAVGTRRIRHRATAHRNCIIWCPEVCADEQGQLINVDKAVSRANRIKCRFCGEKGASIGCWEPRCSASYHLVCAYDPECDVDLILPDLELWCPKHAEGPTYRAHEEAKREALAAASVASEEDSATETPSRIEKRHRAEGQEEDMMTPPRDANGTMQFSPRAMRQDAERIAPPSGQRHFRGYSTGGIRDEAASPGTPSIKTARSLHQTGDYTVAEPKRKRGRPRRQPLVPSDADHVAPFDGSASRPTAALERLGRERTSDGHRTRGRGRPSRVSPTEWDTVDGSLSEDDFDIHEDRDVEEQRVATRPHRSREALQKGYRSSRQLTLTETYGKYATKQTRTTSSHTEESATSPQGRAEEPATSDKGKDRASDSESAHGSDVSARGEEGLERDEAEWKWELERRKNRGKRRAGDQKASKLFSHILADVTAETLNERQQQFQPISGEALQRFIREAEPYTARSPQDYQLREDIPHLLQTLPWIEARPNLFLCEQDQVLYFYTRTDVWGWYADIRSICGASHPHTIRVINKPRPEHRLSIYLKWTKPGEPIGGFRFTDPFNTLHAFRDNILMMKWILNGPFKRTRSCDLIAHGQCYFPELPTARLWFSLSREIIRGLKPIPTTILPYRAYLDTVYPTEANQSFSGAPTRTRLLAQDGHLAYRMTPASSVGATTVATVTAQSVGAGASPSAFAGTSRARFGRLPSANWMVTRSIDGTFAEQAREHIRRQGYGFELDDMEGADASSEEEEVLAQIVQRYKKQLELIGEPPEPADRFWPLSENTDPSLRVLDCAWKVEAQHSSGQLEQRQWARFDALFRHDSDNLVILPLNEMQLREKHGNNYTNAVSAAAAYNRDVLNERQALIQQRCGDKGISLTWNPAVDVESASEAAAAAGGSEDERPPSMNLA